MGLLNVCKLPGMSSHEVVSRIRRIAGMKRVGHTGTLDPAACGVLIVCLGPATRLADYIAAGPKSYRAEITFGVTTDSADADGIITGRVDASGVREAEIAAALQSMTGDILQRPPAHSAILIDGKRAYHLARQGEIVDIPPRPVTIYAADLQRFQPGSSPRVLVDITCSKGTYIRSLARDLGDSLGVGATLTFLARTQVGVCQLANTHTLDELTEAAHAGNLASYLEPLDAPLHYIPSLQLPPPATPYRHGLAAEVEANDGLYRVYTDGLFLGLGRCEEGLLHPVVNLQ